MEIRLLIRNPLTKEKTTLTAYSKEQAKSMIKGVIEDGWRIKIDDNNKSIIKILINELKTERSEMERKPLEFKEWREMDNPGWYLSRENQEELFERYLVYKHKILNDLNKENG